ncbi:MAG: cbb3-type cytochrome oxidase assembly protein CcoS [Tepidisphaerales bacterium]
MSVLFIVLPLAIVMAGVALVAFLLSVKRGQFDDLDTPAVRMLFDEESDGATERRSDEATKRLRDGATERLSDGATKGRSDEEVKGRSDGAAGGRSDGGQGGAMRVEG